MAERTMTPSQQSMTDGQVESAVNQLRDAMRKHRIEISKDAAQQVLGVENLGMQMFAVFRNLAELMDNFIVRRVNVDRSRTPQAVLERTDRRQYTIHDVVDAMPKGKGEEAEVVFFKVGRFLSDIDLEKEYELRGLIAADPYSLAAINEEDSAFADDHPNCTQWKGSNRRWCYAAFDRWFGERRVNVDRGGGDWYGFWWFAGLRQ